MRVVAISVYQLMTKHEKTLALGHGRRGSKQQEDPRKTRSQWGATTAKKVLLKSSA